MDKSLNESTPSNIAYTKTRRYCPDCGLRTVWAADNTAMRISLNGPFELGSALRLMQMVCTACGVGFTATDSRNVAECDPGVRRAYEAACRAEQRQHRNRVEQTERRLAERKRLARSRGRS